MSKIGMLGDIENKSFTVIKRDGREEPYFKRKMKKVALWSCDGDESMADILLRDTEVKVKDKIKIKDLYRNLVETAENKVSQIQPRWQFIASKLYLLELYAEAYNIKDKKYPHLKDVLKKGTSSKVYSADIYSKYSEEDIEYLNGVIDQKKDLTFSINALRQFNKKYCKNYSKTKKLELPQLTYMRVAMGLCFNLGSEFIPKMKIDRLTLIERLYHILSDAHATLATPIMVNSFTPLNQFASCILNTIGNSTWDLMNKLTTAGLYTKGRGGLAFDVTHVQAKGGYTKNGVETGGIVPFIRNIQSVVQSMMQSDTRRGSAVITCHWWHLDIEDFLELKDSSGGTEENRAVHLQYSLGTNDYLYNKVINDEDIYLFDPIDVPELLNTYGKEWEEHYERYVNKHGIRRRKLNAKEIFKPFLKYSFQTGNVYEVFLDNVNRRSMTNRYIGSSNLCHEILEASRPGKLVKESIIVEDGKEHMVTKFEDEEIALCNLASFNYNIVDLPEEEMYDIVYIISTVLDNTIDIGRYMRVAGKKTNLEYRYIALGKNNYANFMARHKTKMDSEYAQELTFKAAQKLSNAIIYCNTILAEEKGRCPAYDTTLWAEGQLPYDSGNELLKQKFGHLYNDKMADVLRRRIKEHGVRNALMTATAPTASSATSRDLTESIEPIIAYSYELDGAISTRVLVPDFAELNQYYSLAYETDQFKLLTLNGIRQLFEDQSQSFNLWIKEENWDYKYLSDLHVYAWKIGTKTIYYTNTPKNQVAPGDSACDGCSS